MATKLKQLSIGMAIIVLGLMVLLAISSNAIAAYWFGESTYGEVINYQVSRERPANFTVSQRTPERHQIVVQYSINDEMYQVLANSHLYSAVGVINPGDRLLVAVNQNNPAHGYVLGYALFSPIVSVLTPWLFVMLLILTPQWIYYLRK